MCVPLDILAVLTTTLEQFNDDVKLGIQMATTFNHIQQTCNAAKIEFIQETGEKGKENLFTIAIDMDLDTDLGGGEANMGATRHTRMDDLTT